MNKRDDDPIPLATAAADFGIPKGVLKANGLRRASWNRYNKKRYASDPQKVIEHVLKWQRENKTLANEKNKKWRRENPDKVRWYGIKQSFDMTKEQWLSLFESQGYVCAICGSDSSGSKTHWHTDHCHETGKVRGILCHPCNTMLGRAKDRPEILEAGASYLVKHRGGQ